VSHARSALLLTGAVVFGALANRAHRATDEGRFAARRAQMAEYQPNGEALKVAALGQPTLLADAMWVRAVLQFTDVMDGSQVDGTRWLQATLDAVTSLDPGWRTPYFYGGVFMRVLGDIDGSDRVFEAGMSALPADPFFPFSIGMNAYLHRGDSDVAAEMMKHAATLPGAPVWYGAAAASFIEQRGQRAAAVRYLDEELGRTTNPAVRASLESRRAGLIHDELCEKLEELVARFTAEVGRAPRAISELGELPPDPYGVGWVLGPDGVVRSEHVDESLARAARTDERAMIMRDPSGAELP
jgi:hypothetical protein